MPGAAQWMSPARFEEYLVAANHGQDAALELYQWNIEVSAGFFELISYVEVALRNAVDNILAPLEVAPTARVEVARGWWFASPTFLDNDALKFYEAACKHLGKKASTASRDKLLASMTFGIWESIFGKKDYEELFRKHLVHAFPHRPAGFTRSSVHTNVLALRNLRNRVAHHQAIFDLPLEERYEQAMDLLGWIDPDLQDLVREASRVPGLLDARPSAAESIAVIVPAKHAWPFYQEHGVYICRPGRYFKNVSHLGFYAEQAIQPEVPKILKRIDDVTWTPEEIGRLMDTHLDEDAKLAEIIKAGRDSHWTGQKQQVFFLTRPDEEGRGQGHLTLSSELKNLRAGRGSAWVRRQRYAPIAALENATTLAELDNQ